MLSNIINNKIEIRAVLRECIVSVCNTVCCFKHKGLLQYRLHAMLLLLLNPEKAKHSCKNCIFREQTLANPGQTAKWLQVVLYHPKSSEVQKRFATSLYLTISFSYYTFEPMICVMDTF